MHSNFKFYLFIHLSLCAVPLSFSVILKWQCFLGLLAVLNLPHLSIHWAPMHLFMLLIQNASLTFPFMHNKFILLFWLSYMQCMSWVNQFMSLLCLLLLCPYVFVHPSHNCWRNFVKQESDIFLIFFSDLLDLNQTPHSYCAPQVSLYPFSLVFYISELLSCYWQCNHFGFAHWENSLSDLLYMLMPPLEPPFHSVTPLVLFTIRIPLNEFSSLNLARSSSGFLPEPALLWHVIYCDISFHSYLVWFLSPSVDYLTSSGIMWDFFSAR